MADYFVDYSATNDGTGAAANQAASAGAAGAYNTLSGKTFAAGDKVWVRRVSSSTLAATLTLSQTVGVSIVGWPMSGDDFYSTRPASGTSNGWDSDSASYFTLLWASASFKLSITGSSYTFYRMKVQNNTASAVVWSITGTTNTFYDCYGLHNNATAITTAGIFDISAGSNTFVRCKWEGQAATNASASVLNVASGTSVKLFDCIVNVTSIAGTASRPVVVAVSDCLIRGLTINITSGTSVMNVLLVSGSNCVIADVDVVASAGVTSYTALSVTGSNNRITNIQTNSGGGGTNGHLVMTGSNNIVTFRKAAQNPTTGTNGINLTTGAGNHVTLKNVVFQGNTQDVQMGAAANNVVLCNNCSFSSSPVCSASMHETSQFGSYNHNLAAGSYHAEFLNGTIDSSTTYRTGGETFSFKFQSTSAGVGERGQLQMGIPGIETIWLALSAGSRTLTLYGAHKNFVSSVPKKHHLWFEFEYLDASNNYVHVSTYAYGTSLESDASTWNNDTGLTVFKITAPAVAVGADCVVPVRIFYQDYESGGYTYIDPKIGVA